MEDNPAVQRLTHGKDTLPLSSLIQEALTIAMSYRAEKRSIIVIKNSLYNAQRLYDRMSTLLGEKECALFGVDESLRVEAIASSPEMMANQVDTLASLLEEPHQVIITNPSGILRYLPHPETFASGCIELKTGDRLDMEELKRRLRAGGYFQTTHIDQPLSFAARGGIVDVFSINYDLPVRIEFFDDEIDSIRFFDVETQKTALPADKVKIVPANTVLFTEEEVSVIEQKAREYLEKEDEVMLSSAVEADLELIRNSIRETRLYPYMALLEKTSGLWEYMDHPQIILSDEDSIYENTRHLLEETTVYIQEMVQEKKLLPKYVMWHDLSRIAPGSSFVREDPFMDNLAGIEELHLPEEPMEVRLKMINDGRINLLCLQEQEARNVIETCTEIKIPYFLVTDDHLQPGINLWFGNLSQGFTYDLQNLRVISGREMFSVNRHSGRYEKKFRKAEVLHSYEDLQLGDYIVHASHGVGQYMGIETRQINGMVRDFLRIVYRGNAELLVPLEQFRLVRKYVSREGVVPRLNKLGSDEWAKTKQRLEENVSNIAERLVKLYAAREENIGFAFSPDTEMQKKFEASFEFDLTEDQKKAINEIKKDMESTKPMDRLVCGDVGFGKTEVAIQAAFKAVSDNKQTAVLCPTTILAEQHYQTFTQRFKDYPVNIEVLDRFVTPARVRDILRRLTAGEVDILIGTHRILSKDVIFKDLGLLVIDEEQRFGVEHKERIKELKNGIDVLTLSATPIPRTLQMSLIGIRQLSQLDTPPENRYNVQTYVVEKNDGLVRDAIEKELSRGGQVFYLFNNIDKIYNVARKIQGMIDDVRVGVVHGKMDREAIEDVMFSFTRHQLDVLVCTTIIENGIDIPNANTIIIDNAQDFGLAQIYQIKGRVGRSDRVAYAYLLIPPRKQLSEVAQKRLQAVKEFAKLGSGYKIAMRDLTIRGAGDLLGADQSGFIDTVGIDMYIEMLEEAIAREKGEVRETQELPKHINIEESSYIPKDFAPDDYDKISMYQKIDQIADKEELQNYRDQVIDQYGKLPKEVRSLFDKKEIDILVSQEDVKSYRQINGNNEVVFSEKFSSEVDGVKLFELFTAISKDIRIQYKNKCIIALLPKQKNNLPIVIEMITRAGEAKRDAN
ncbi:MAG: transcription-repair coupling factor [Solobacterium sp.]|nr:transcription-repair coupling factor [Solobacterium sp.]